VTDLVLAAMAMLLGAASLAIFLLYRGWRSNARQIQQLRAELATYQIMAMSSSQNRPGSIGDLPSQEPVRRRGHLALYLGGGVVAVFTSCRDNIKALITRRPALAATAAATVATVGTAAALVLVPNGSEPGDPPGPSSASTDDGRHPGPGRSPSPGTSGSSPDGTGPRGEVWADGPHDLTVTDTGRRILAGKTRAPTLDRAAAESSSAPSRGGDVQPTPREPKPDDPFPSQPPATIQPPTNHPQPSPTAPGAEDPEPPTSPDPDDGLLCLDVPNLVDLCLLGKR
jgi:hypothetical protein